MRKFFEVVTKCGHVGRQQYYRGVFYMSAENGKEAASVARTFPRVKHDHPDAILQVRCISKEEYLEGRSRFLKEAYFQCHNVQEQRSRWSEISPKSKPPVRRKRAGLTPAPASQSGKTLLLAHIRRRRRSVRNRSQRQSLKNHMKEERI